MWWFVRLKVVVECMFEEFIDDVNMGGYYFNLIFLFFCF